jgi:hypothetical protein
MTENMRIWDAVSKTDPKHTKPFKRAGGFQGTAIKPIWLTKRLTEQFGPAGIGWGMDEPTFQTVAAMDEILVFCTVALWYADGEKRGTVYGVGGDKVLGKNKYGPFTNDEAFKASYTDALSNAMKQIGMGADIHMGLFEDEKYVRETTREFANAASLPEDARDEARNQNIRQGLAPKAPSKNDGAANAKAWTDAAIETLHFVSIGRDIDEWFEANAKAFDRLEANHPDQFKRIEKAAADARDRCGALAA